MLQEFALKGNLTSRIFHGTHEKRQKKILPAKISSVNSKDFKETVSRTSEFFIEGGKSANNINGVSKLLSSFEKLLIIQFVDSNRFYLTIKLTKKISTTVTHATLLKLI